MSTLEYGTSRGKALLCSRSDGTAPRSQSAGVAVGRLEPGALPQIECDRIFGDDRRSPPTLPVILTQHPGRWSRATLKRLVSEHRRPQKQATGLTRDALAAVRTTARFQRIHQGKRRLTPISRKPSSQMQRSTFLPIQPAATPNLGGGLGVK